MKIGVTGTRSGMTDKQKQETTDVLANIISMEGEHEFHHGDCVGVDVELAEIAQSLGFKVVCHPPIKHELRAYHESDVILEPLSYFARNRKIVDNVDFLMVVPYQMEWQPSGGTWYTRDYAKKKEVTFNEFWPA